VRLFLVAKLWPMIIPSAQLSKSAQALISLPECFPTRDTWRVIEGLLIFQIVPLGTGSELTVSNNTVDVTNLFVTGARDRKNSCDQVTLTSHVTIGMHMTYHVTSGPLGYHMTYHVMSHVIRLA